MSTNTGNKNVISSVSEPVKPTSTSVASTAGSTSATTSTTTTSSTTAASTTTTTTATTTTPTSSTTTTGGSSTATSTTTTTTTATTATSGATTTTTTTTTTAASAAATAAAQISAAQNLLKQFNDVVTKCNNSLYYLRRLRHQMAQMHIDINNVGPGPITAKKTMEVYKQYEKMAIAVKESFERLDYYARQFPKCLPRTDSLNTMRRIYSEELISDNGSGTKMLENMIDAGNWNEGQYQSFFYLSELLRITTRKRLSALNSYRPIQFSKHELSSGHQIFEQAYQGLKKEISQKQLGIYPKTIRNNSNSMIVEFKFGVGGTEKSTKNTVVFLLKFLLLEKNGIIEYINVIAPHEEWRMDGDFSEPVKLQINPVGRSRYKSYQGLTRQANMHLLNSFGTSNRWTSTTLIQFVTLFGKMRDIFQTKCSVCKKILKDFMPPLLFDIRNPSIAVHESCK